MTPLPDVLRTYLTAHAARDVPTALAAFAPDAEVTDEGLAQRGTAEIEEWIRTAGAQFTFTTELRGGEQVDERTWLAHVRIEGDFPGGTADLTYRFVLADGLVRSLHISA
jgi:hypothetical protein